MAGEPKTARERLERLLERGVRHTSRDPSDRDDDHLLRALEVLRVIMVEVGPDGRNLYVSPSLTPVLGYEPDEVLARDGLSFVPEEDHPTLLEMARQLAETGQPVKGIFRSRHKSGHWVWLECTSMLLETPEGEQRTVTLARDVTDRITTADALRASEDRFSALTEHASDLIVEVDESGRLLFVSPNCKHILGLDARELLGHSITEFAGAGKVHPDDRHAMLEGFRRTRQNRSGRGTREARLLHADGSWRWFDSRFTTYHTPDGAWRALVISRDVTERIRAEQELRESDERYRLISETTHEVITELDAEGRVVFASPAIETALGIRPEQIVGTTPAVLLHPDDVERVVDRFLAGVQSREPIHIGRYRVRHRNGSWHWVESEGIAFEHADGAVHFLAVARDITEERRVERERQQLGERMQQAQRLEGLGVMAGGIAHDFNNLLTPILGDASLALMDLPAGSPLRERILKIQKAARRAAALTHQMLAYAGKGPLLVDALDLSSLVREIAQLLESSVARKAEVDYELAEDLPAIEGDAAQLTQVVMNLITNASESVKEAAGHIAIRTGLLEAGWEARAGLLGEELPVGPAVYLEVEDNGCGMDETTRARIFDPFFTTKFTGRGLGLAAALGIVRGHGGAIEIDSHVGEGTRFRVVFPASKHARRVTAPVRTDIRNWRSQGVVLVVDDDEGVRDLARETLERAGMHVLVASDATAGIDLYRTHADEIELVILDRTMPTISGEEAFHALRAIRADARIVLLSGYSRERAAKRLTAKGLAGFLQKPFLPEDLLEKVRSLIERH